MVKKLVVLICVFVFSFTQVAFSAVGETPVEVVMPSGNVAKMTKSQLDTLIAKPGIGFSSAEPPATLPKGQIAISLPKELGGGYLLGTPEAIANGMNATKITVGATNAWVVGGGISAGTVALIVVGAGAIAAAALGGGGGGGTTTTSHH
ncbi:MAG: hypothetical protein HZC12_09055 [Nitrospirae bacterium]|nr:hypothetical protein [Nitrospirota bacterium]